MTACLSLVCGGPSGAHAGAPAPTPEIPTPEIQAPRIQPPQTQVAEGHAKPKEKAKEPEKKPEGEEKPEPKKPPKPKPKKPNKDKNCQWDEDIDVEIDNKHLKLTQLSLKNVMRGGRSEQDGYNVYADTDKLVLKIRAPDGNWYVGTMTRLGDLDEGCVFYMVGELRQVDGRPPLF